MLPSVFNNTQVEPLVETDLEYLHELNLNAGQFNAVAKMLLKAHANTLSLSEQVSDIIKVTNNADTHFANENKKFDEDIAGLLGIIHAHSLYPRTLDIKNTDVVGKILYNTYKKAHYNTLMARQDEISNSLFECFEEHYPELHTTPNLNPSVN